MLTFLLVMGLLGWCLGHDYRHQPLLHSNGSHLLAPKAHNASIYTGNLPYKQTYALANKSYLDVEAQDYINSVASGINMNTNESKPETKLNLNAMLNTSVMLVQITSEQPPPPHTGSLVPDNKPYQDITSNTMHATTSTAPVWSSSKGPPTGNNTTVQEGSSTREPFTGNTTPPAWSNSKELLANDNATLKDWTLSILPNTVPTKSTEVKLDDNTGTHSIRVPGVATNSQGITTKTVQSGSAADTTHLNSTRHQQKEEKENDDPNNQESLLSHEHSVSLEQGMAGSRSPRRNDLCSACLCDTMKKNVYCKHEHLYNGASEHLTLSRELIPQNATSLHILNFKYVTINNGTFSSENLGLRKIHFENIGLIHLFKNSLYFSYKAKENMEVAVVFTKCNIREIPSETLTQYSRSKDQRNDIDLQETRFLTLQFEWCNITTIARYALSNARILYFKMHNVKVENMEENAIHLDIYEEWLVEYCSLPRLVSHTICLRAQMVVVFSHNIMKRLENKSLDIISSSQVLFEYNYVMYLGADALAAIKPYPNARGANIVFLNNTVEKAVNRSLVISRNYPSYERKILDNRFNILCECNIHDTFKQLLGISEKSDYNDQLTQQVVIEKSRCQRKSGLALYKNVRVYYSEECTSTSLPLIISATSVVVVIIIAIIVCIVCIRRAEKAKEEANYLGECCYSQSFSTLHSNAGPLSPLHGHHCFSFENGNSLQPWVVAVPEVKTYQETEVDVHYEHTEPINVNIRGSYPEPTSPIDFQRRVHTRASCPFN
ncbi:uncharacterized protein [Cherax quadricarinatus]|uniref:uncharacterized protein n=1 Tax=Cherax quadricarinatus TaxID=27406 RepID=UPI00387E2D33